MFRRNRGSALLYAVFLIIIFSFLGLVIVNLLSTTSTVSSENLLYSEALSCAEAGKEIAIMQCLDGSCSNAAYDFNKNKILIRYVNSVTLPNGKTLYTATSECIMSLGNIKREIEFKFWK